MKSMMKGVKKMKKFKDEATRILVTSIGYVATSLLLAIGINLVVEEIWFGILIIIAGYELGRKVTIWWLKELIEERFAK